THSNDVLKTRFRVAVCYSVFKERGRAGTLLKDPTFVKLFLRWWSVRGSNPRPPACKAGALPAELTPRNLVWLGAPLAGASLVTPGSRARFRGRRGLGSRYVFVAASGPGKI